MSVLHTQYLYGTRRRPLIGDKPVIAYYVAAGPRVQALLKVQTSSPQGEATSTMGLLTV